VARLRDAATGEVIRPFVGTTSHNGGLAFSPDGHRLVTGGSRSVRVWNVETGKELLSLPGAGADAMAVAWVGDRVYALDDRVRIWSGEPE
jgi:WD40 repeat protein